MDYQTYRITCDRSIAEELIEELRKDESASLNIDESTKDLSGIEVLTIIANLTTIGSSLLTVWLAARPHLKERVKIDKAEE